MKSDAFEYENPWRPNYEMTAAGTWIGGATVALGVNMLSNLPDQPFYWMTGICAAMAVSRLPAAIRLANLQKHLKGRPLEFITLEKLTKNVSKKEGVQWLGNGFVWEKRHAQRTHEILKRDTSKIVKNDIAKVAGSSIGQSWIHGIEPKEEKIYQNLDQANLMNLIVGTTGSGKTRLFEILISQAILRREAVIIIDPKGDIELRNTARRVCELVGSQYNFFHPAFPEESVRLDLLRNFSRPTEIATRLIALLPSEGGPDPFKAFGWRAINNLVQAFYIISERPNIIMIKRFLETGVDEIVAKAICAYARKEIPDAERLIADAYHAAGGEDAPAQKIATALTRMYYNSIQSVKTSPELDGLISMYKHDATHFSKMVTNILPALAQLTTGELASMLNPDYKDLTDNRPITDNNKIIQNGEVLVMGLDSLTDPITGSSLGSLELSDLVAVAGARYNFGKDNKPVNIFIDEAAEVLNDPTIALLNKGRGAGMRLYVATQTIADFETRLGSESKALQVLGNLNNIIALRCIDPKTQEFIVGSLPKTRIDVIAHKQDIKTDSNNPHLFSAGFGESKQEEEADLFPSALLSQLPNLEYIAKLSGTIVKGRLPILKG
jgi:conjugal transfer pilus assembly protein TraD